MTTFKLLRKKYGLSLRAFAERTGFTHPYISRVENGHETISRKNIEKIAKEFDEPLEPLLIAYGYLPPYTEEARQKDPEYMNNGIRKLTKRINARIRDE